MRQSIYISAAPIYSVVMSRFPIFWQLLLAFALFVVLPLVALGLIGGGWMRDAGLQAVEERLRSKAALLDELVRGQNLEQLQGRLRSLREEFGPRIALIGADGRVVAESDRDDPSSLADREIASARAGLVGVTTRHSATTQTNTMYLARRVSNAQSLVEFVRVALPIADIEKHVRHLQWLTWGTAATTAAFALFLAWWLARRVVRPVQMIREGAAAVAAGDYGHKVYSERQDELGALAGAFNQMSERLASQFSQLDHDRQQLRAVLGSMVEGVIAVDAAQTVLFANDRAGELLEFGVSQAVGRRLWEVVRYRPVHDLVERLLSAPELGGQNLDWLGPGQRSFTVHAAPLPGRPVRGAVLVLHDVTEMRRLERVRQEFVANVSHELKTPLSVIVACAETLQSGAVDDVENRGRFLERIATQAQRLFMLIVDMIDLAKVEAGTEQFKRDEVAVDAAVLACIERHQERARAKNQRLEAVPPARIPPDGVTAWSDPDALSQILDNLVDNAIKYTPAEGLIQLHWWAEDSKAIVEVRDTGIGIPEHELPRVFERFYRVDKARSREMGGTGLGLSIVKHLAQAMGGGVRVASQVGQGTSFTVVLPQTDVG
ncbi:MAG: ATP-binding protein [Gemmataceae bacterium]|nr:ATP-binding protein [Gemmataceae bacterium]